MFFLVKNTDWRSLLRCLAGFVVLSLGMSLFGCGPSVEDKDPSRNFEFQIANLSQFDLDYVYLHSPNTPYKQTAPLVDATLYVDDHISMLISPGDYMVTVVRQKNFTGDKLAYTTESPLYLNAPKRLVYYDDYYRLGEIEVFDDPDKDSLVISSDDEANGCFIMCATPRPKSRHQY